MTNQPTNQPVIAINWLILYFWAQSQSNQVTVYISTWDNNVNWSTCLSVSYLSATFWSICCTVSGATMNINLFNDKVLTHGRQICYKNIFIQVTETDESLNHHNLSCQTWRRQVSISTQFTFTSFKTILKLLHYYQRPALVNVCNFDRLGFHFDLTYSQLWHKSFLVTCRHVFIHFFIPSFIDFQLNDRTLCRASIYDRIKFMFMIRLGFSYVRVKMKAVGGE